MMSRKILTCVLALAMVCSTFSVSFAEADQTPVEPVLISAPAETSAAGFTDVTNHWGKEAITKWSGYGIINGYEGLFRPDDSITRGEMAVILDNMMDYQEVAVNNFTDLPAGQFYTQAVLKANAAGIILGDGKTVRPLDKITREESAIMMSRAFDVMNTPTTKAFTDADQVSTWAKNAVFGMEAKGYVNGYNGYFEPKANITRAATITMINNIVKAYYTTAGTYTENVTGTAVIKVPGVILKDMNISENLIIAEGVGSGNVTLDNVDVAGNTVVRGGGENSIIIINANLANITVTKIDGKVRIVVSGSTTVGEVTIHTGALLVEGTLTSGSTGFEEIILHGEVGDTIVLVGEFSTIEIDTPDMIIDIPAGTTVENLIVNEDTAVTGEGVVENAQINVSGVTFVTEPEEVIVKAGVTAPVIGEEPAAPGGGVPTSPGDIGGSTVDHPDFALTNLKYNGEAPQVIGDVYQIAAAAITTSSDQAIDVTVVGSGFDNSKVYAITVTVSRTSSPEATKTATIQHVAGGLLNQTQTNSVGSISELLDFYTNTLSLITSGTPVDSFTPLLKTQGVGAEYTVTFTYSTVGQSGALDGGVFKFKLI